MFDQTCSNCSKTFSRNAKFCPYCGAQAGGGRQKCRYCGADMPGDAKFCPVCGRSTEGGQTPAVKNNTWARGADDFATRIEIDDLEGTLRRDLIVEPGTQAIILRDGRNEGTLGPGRYDMQTLADRLTLRSLRGHATALLVDTGEVDLDLIISDVYTRDPLKISLECHVAASVGEPVALITNLLKGAQSLPLSQLRSYLYDEIRDAAQECVGERSASELNTNLALKQEFALAIAAHLDETLRKMGLQFSRVRTMNFRHARWNELTQQQEEYFLQVTKEEADLAHRKRLFDVMDQTMLQDIVEESRKLQQEEQELELHKRRMALRDQMRQAVQTDEFADLRTAREKEVFLRGLDRERLISDDEWAELQRSMDWKTQDQQWTRQVTVEDRDRERAHLLARLKLENDYELKQIELSQRTDLSQAELALQLKLERQRVDGEQGIEAAQQAFRLEQARQAAAQARNEQQLDDIARRERTLEDTKVQLAVQIQSAQTADQVAELERKQDQADMEMLLVIHEKKKAQDRLDEEERQRIALVGEERRLTMRLTEARQAFEQEMARQAQEQQFELDRMAQLKDLPPEAVVAVSDAERGRIILDMQRTNAMKGMTEQQILAMMSANSPQAAQALAEVAKAGAEGRLGQEQVAMYERLLDQNKAMLDARDKAAQQVADAYKEAAQRTQEIAVKALDSQRDGMVGIAQATSHAPAPQPGATVVLAGTGGAPTVLGGPGGMTAAGGNIVCRKCGTTSPAGTRFCQNCGNEFYSPASEK